MQGVAVGICTSGLTLTRADEVDDDCPLVSVTEPHGRFVDIDKARGLVASGFRLEIGELFELTTVIESEGLDESI